MRPREAQVAFVLEAVPGVLGLFSIARSETHLGGCELAVQVDGPQAFGPVNAALLLALRPEECH